MFRVLDGRGAAVRSVIAVLAATMVLGGCGTPKPTAYDKVVKANFVHGCRQSLELDKASKAEASRSSEFCTCAYEQMAAKVPWKDFEAFDTAQAEAEEKGKKISPPANISRVIEDCRARSESGSGSPETTATGTG